MKKKGKEQLRQKCGSKRVVALSFVVVVVVMDVGVVMVIYRLNAN